jgi:SAM-dependent methyltransferase
MRPTGGTGSARYCYSVWLRHLILGRAHAPHAAVPAIAAELGPGDSIGIGLAALLSGVEKYYALDLVRYSDLTKNLSIFEELAGLFKSRARVPAEDEFPFLLPKLANYGFPHHLLDSARLDGALRRERIAEIKSSIERAESAHSMIIYQAPWSDAAVIRKQSVDLIYSQAVLEHVDNLYAVYETMHRWLKPDGTMSHQIDFKCHGKADTWNGHWTYSDLAWKLVVGRRPYLLNRAPHSEHVRLLQTSGFRIVSDSVIHTPSVLHQAQLARRFRALSEADLTTSGAFVVAVPQ